MKELYGTEWILRLYYQISKDSLTWTKLCSLVCNDPNIDICDAEDNPMYGKFVNKQLMYENVNKQLKYFIFVGNISKVFPLNWRFLPALDKQVDIILVRDLDSNITPREVSAYEDFIQSEKHIHIMRDHPDHGVQMLGGTWGAKLDQQFVRENFNNSFRKMFKDPIFYTSRRKGGSDQTILKKYVW